MKIMVANIGSTSFKYKILKMDTGREIMRGKAKAGEEVLLSGRVERIGAKQCNLLHAKGGKVKRLDIPEASYLEAIRTALDLITDRHWGVMTTIKEIEAVGFKVAHGGKISGARIIDEKVLNALEEYKYVMPVHNPPYLQAIYSFQDILPDTPLVAAFETAFHMTQPEYARLYAVPYEWYDNYGIQKYGFHGASHRYVTERAAELLDINLEDLNLITCHLGGSSSINAIKGGKSIDNSFGFTTQSGLIQSNRCGVLDPFVVYYLENNQGIPLLEIKEKLGKKSGLLGISGISNDMRDLETAAGNGSSRAKLAIDSFVYEIKKQLGAYYAVLDRVDAVVFTAGIGERGAGVRERICENLEHLGLKIDREKNTSDKMEKFISAVNSETPILVIPTNEELIVARETYRVISGF